MCGISGIINKNDTAVDPGAIRAITDLVAHRGPDGDGFYFGDCFAFGHRRLAILDVSSAGSQPMAYLQRYVITYNGEVYNFVELKTQLARCGYHFDSDSDTEVILAAYDKWGEHCVDHFNGMWSFAIYDVKRHLIFCSRDRFGVKPFYYSDGPAQFVFGSEIKQVLRAGGGTAVANMAMVRDFLVEGLHDHTSATFFQGVHALKAGHNLVYRLDDHVSVETRWYSLFMREELPQMGAHAATSRFLQELKQSVRYRLRSDVKVGTCLSGGLDSSSIASLSSTLYHASSGLRFQAVHARASERAIDESGFARELADSCGIDLAVIEPSAADFTAAVDDVAWCQEEPFAAPSIVMQFFVFKKAREIGCKVMLDGQGGDEVMLGYERYFAAHLKSLARLAALRELWSIRNHASLSLRDLLARLAYFSFAPVRIGALRRRYAFVKDRYLADFPNIRALAAATTDVRAMQKLEIESFQLPHLLRYEDRNSMHHSVEARLPFLDYRLVETCYGIDSRLKIRQGWTKHILRVAMQGLAPATILWRTNKLGFEAPVATWIASMRPAMETTIGQSQIIKQLCKRDIDLARIDRATFWKLYSIAKWEAVYAVQADAAAN
ncbi:asparagine synthase (glutamine-hydrolyzing) [Massilia sp. PWRC2]|uniref:asparagine synthase (glutamine-hydrolyzing) n=1 Tax=Massilia sp. PWRC2 TaxID=2804626 RepID=UPI003CF79970